MKCPECGQWNRASMPHCTRCGTPLNIDASSRVAWKDTLRDSGSSTAYLRADEFGMVDDTPDSRDTLAGEMQDLKKRKKRGAELKEQLRGGTAAGHSVRTPAGSRTAADFSAPEGKAEQPVSAGLSPSDAKMRRESEIRHRVRFMDDASTFIEPRSYDPLLPEYPGAGRSRSVTYTSAFSPYKTHDGRTIFRRIAAVFLALVILGGGGYFAWNRFFAKREPRYSNSAIITSTISNDLAEHTILIPGEEGTTIYIKELHASYVVVDGYATIEIPDHIWYDNMETLGETMDVTLTPFLKNSSGRQTPLDLISYTISIPLSPLTLDTPNTLRTTVSTTMANIIVNVRPGSHVTVDGKDYSDIVNDDGELSFNTKVQPIGENYLTIVTRAQYCRENSITLVLYRAKQEIPLDLAPETPTSTYNQHITVNGSTVPGAYVKVLTTYSDLNVTHVDATGEFSFEAFFDHIGDNTISILATSDGKTTQVDHVVYYVPIADIYTKKAFSLGDSDYSELLANIDARSKKGQIYEVKGYVQYFESEKPQIAVFNTSEDGKSRPVYVENKSKTKWVQGNYYRLFADVYGTWSTMPAMYARYTYEK